MELHVGRIFMAFAMFFLFFFPPARFATFIYKYNSNSSVHIPSQELIATEGADSASRQGVATPRHL